MKMNRVQEKEAWGGVICDSQVRHGRIKTVRRVQPAVSHSTAEDFIHNRPQHFNPFGLVKEVSSEP